MIIFFRLFRILNQFNSYQNATKKSLPFFSLSIFSYGQDASIDLKSLYSREDIVIEYQDDWGKNNYKKVIKEFKMKPLNFNDIVF